MPVLEQDASGRDERLCRTAAICAVVMSADALLGCLLVELNTPTDLEAWRWAIGAAVVAILLSAVAVAMRRGFLGAALGAPLTGAFVGIVTTVILGVVAIAAEWIVTVRQPSASLRVTVLAGLPCGAVIGALLGLCAGLVLRVVTRPSPSRGHQPSRRRFQFGLRMLFFTVLVVAVLLSIALWMATPVQRNYQHQHAVSHLAAIGARISFDADDSSEWIEPLLGRRVDPQWHAGVRELTMDLTMGQSACDDDLEFLEHLPELRSLTLVSPQVTDAGLIHLEPLRGLQRLSLACPEITGESLRRLSHLPIQHLTLLGHTDNGEDFEHLSHWTELRTLILRGAPITSAALGHLSTLPNLEMLNLNETSIRDNDLPALAQFEHLRRLHLSDTAVTDAGLAHLEAIPSLTEVSLYQTSATKAGAERLRAALQTRDARATVHGP
jgi:hypothetical protein